MLILDLHRRQESVPKMRLTPYEQACLEYKGETIESATQKGRTVESVVRLVQTHCPGLRIQFEELKDHREEAAERMERLELSRTPWTSHQQMILDSYDERRSKFLERRHSISTIVANHESKYTGSRKFYEELENHRRLAVRASLVKEPNVTLYQQAVVKEKNYDMLDLREQGYDIGWFVKDEEEEDPGLRERHKKPQRSRTGAHVRTSARSRSRSPKTRDKSASHRTRSPVHAVTSVKHGVKTGSAAKETTPREELRNFCRKHGIDLDAAEEGGETLREVLSQIERKAKRQQGEWC